MECNVSETMCHVTKATRNVTGAGWNVSDGLGCIAVAWKIVIKPLICFIHRL
jgi:hypothetical protein